MQRVFSPLSYQVKLLKKVRVQKTIQPLQLLRLLAITPFLNLPLIHAKIRAQIQATVSATKWSQLSRLREYLLPLLKLNLSFN